MASGGARWGAGRPTHRFKAENAIALEVNYLSRNGHLDEGNWKRLYWRQCGEVRLEGLVKAFDHHITLDTGATTHWQYLTLTPCHLGGHRRWFICPLCQNRMSVLYLRNNHFACRQCQKISYQSQSGDV